MNTQISEYLFNEFLNIHTNFEDDDLYLDFSKKIKLPISLDFISQQTLFQIFTHKSFHHEMNKRFMHNERLEFLGDAVLELMITGKLLAKFPTFNEGELSKFRSSLVNEKSLGNFAKILNLGPHILIGKGEIKTSGHTKPSILSDTFEAMLGGIYMECGFERTVEFFDQCINKLQETTGKDFFNLEAVTRFDAKTKLQELVMKKFKVNPEYECVESKTDGKFIIECKVNGNIIASDSFTSKKKGMQELATLILEKNLIENYTETLCY